MPNTNTVLPAPGVLGKKPEKNNSTSTVDVESFQRSLQMLGEESGPEYSRSLGFPTGGAPGAGNKPAWSQMSTNNFSSLPSTAAPTRTGAPLTQSAKHRLAELNKEYEQNDGAKELRLDVTAGGLGAHGISASTPNILRGQSPPAMLMDGGKHLSDVTRPHFALNIDAKQSSEALNTNRTTNTMSTLTNGGGGNSNRVSLV